MAGNLNEDDLKQMGLTDKDGDIYGTLKKTINKTQNLKIIKEILSDPIAYIHKNTNMSIKELNKVM